MIILASGSPRRKSLLESIGVDFRIFRPDVNEEYLPPESASEYCSRLARTKAQSGQREYPGATVIAADTIVVIDGEILGKPSDRRQAAEMLRKLSGRTHEVITGLAVCSGGIVHVQDVHTMVRFRPLSEREISAYVETGECDDKAGAYAVQGKGSLLIEGISGDYYNVVGLPLSTLGGMLSATGISLL